MKYIWASISGKGSVNAGNILIENCLKQILGFPSPALIIDIFREDFPKDLSNFDYVVLPGSTTLYPDCGSLKNLPPKIPIFCFGGSIWLRSSKEARHLIGISNGLLSVARRMYQPIGCRDPFTFKALRDNSIRAKFIGCPTLFYQSDVETQDFIAFSFSRGNFAKQLQVLLHLKKLYSVKVIIHEDLERELIRNHFVAEENSTDQFKIYAAARSVVTGRLHGALPGIALKKPVFFFSSRNEFDSRLSLLDYLNLPIREIDEIYNLNLSKIEYDFDKVLSLQEAFHSYIQEVKGQISENFCS